MKIETICEVLFETAAEALVVVDGEGTITVVNPRCEEMFGYDLDEMVGQKVDILIPKARWSRHKDHMKNYMEKPAARPMGKGMDLVAVTKSGDEIPVEISLNFFRSTQGNFVMCLITDITERKKAEVRLHELNAQLELRVEERTKELRDSQRLYSLIARHYPNGTINVFDKDLNYVFVEGQGLYRFKVSGDKLIGTSYLKRLPEDVGDTIREKLESVFKGENTTFEISSGGNHYLIYAVGLTSEDGSIQQILVVEQNVSDQKKAEQEMLNALNKERELNELKSRFVSMASHEFRTPLSTVLSSVSLLARYNGSGESEKRDRHINRIKNSVHNLTGILNDFLNLDKLETGAVKPNTTEFDVVECANEVIDEINVIKKSGQEIKFSHKGTSTVKLDKGMLKNILINLLSNACKYSDEDQDIEFISKANDGAIEIKIQDHGIGIPEDDKHHMFERFFRARNSTNIQGTGLGLNIVNKYTDLLGGSISFKSKLGEGSTFTVRLPLELEE